MASTDGICCWCSCGDLLLSFAAVALFLSSCCCCCCWCDLFDIVRSISGFVVVLPVVVVVGVVGGGFEP